jgi:hypothetical protein
MMASVFFIFLGMPLVYILLDLHLSVDGSLELKEKNDITIDLIIHKNGNIESI